MKNTQKVDLSVIRLVWKAIYQAKLHKNTKSTVLACHLDLMILKMFKAASENSTGSSLKR